MSSKYSKTRDFMERIALDTLAEVALRDSKSAEWLAQNKSWIAAAFVNRATREYALMELNDIMHWKKPKDINK